MTLYDYKIKCINAVNYELTITLPAQNKLISGLFYKAQKKLLRKKNLHVPDKLDEITEFAVPQQYFNLIQTFIGPVFKPVQDKIRVDKIELMTHRVTNAFFKKNNSEEWDIQIYLEGTYADKRRE